MKIKTYCFIITALIFSACSDSQKEDPKINGSKGNTEHEEKENTSENFKEYSAREAFDFLRENQNNEDVVLLDVRSPREYNSMHIKGSDQINFTDRNFKEKLAALDKEKKYIVVCQSGGRSEIAVEMMEEMNFREAHNIIGGIGEWYSENLPLEKSE